MKANKKHPLKDIIKSVIQKLEKEDQGKSILGVWEKVLDKKTQKHTKPVSFRRGRLVANVSDSSRLYELTLRKKEIIKAMNIKLEKKKIKEIRFKIGEL